VDHVAPGLADYDIRPGQPVSHVVPPETTDPVRRCDSPELVIVACAYHDDRQRGSS
jgi:hypothetical protein